MTIAIDQPIQEKPLSFDDFLAHYGGDNRYELIDGEVFDTENVAGQGICIRRSINFSKEVSVFLEDVVLVTTSNSDLPKDRKNHAGIIHESGRKDRPRFHQGSTRSLATGVGSKRLSR